MSYKPYAACCPLCDNTIEEFEPATLYFDGQGGKCLAHESCVEMGFE